MSGPSPLHANILKWRKSYRTWETCQLESLQPGPVGTRSQLVVCGAPTVKGARHCPDCAQRLLKMRDKPIPLSPAVRLFPHEQAGVPKRRHAKR